MRESFEDTFFFLTFCSSLSLSLAETAKCVCQMPAVSSQWHCRFTHSLTGCAAEARAGKRMEKERKNQAGMPDAVEDAVPTLSSRNPVAATFAGNRKIKLSL